MHHSLCIRTGNPELNGNYKNTKECDQFFKTKCYMTYNIFISIYISRARLLVSEMNDVHRQELFARFEYDPIRTWFPTVATSILVNTNLRTDERFTKN